MSNDHRHDAALQEELARLKVEHQRLREVKVRTEQDVANLDRQLDELRKRAQAEYGTSDPEELAALLAEKRAENETMIAQYQSHLEEIQKGLARVEADVESGTEGGTQGQTSNERNGAPQGMDS